MKTKIFITALTLIVIGIVIPTFASSPENNKGDKTKIDNPAPPPPSWTLHIQLVDITGCDAQNCNLGFLIEPADANCEAYGTPIRTVIYEKGTNDYYPQIPDDYPCVIVRIIDLDGTCIYLFNSNTCCKCKGDPDPCKLKICQ